MTGGGNLVWGGGLQVTGMEPDQGGLSVKINSSWSGNEGASAAALDTLRAAAPRELPSEYYQLLEYSNGGEGPLPDPLFNFLS